LRRPPRRVIIVIVIVNRELRVRVRRAAIHPWRAHALSGARSCEAQGGGRRARSGLGWCCRRRRAAVAVVIVDL
jgi:hypothetical protein